MPKGPLGHSNHRSPTLTSVTKVKSPDCYIAVSWEPVDGELANQGRLSGDSSCNGNIVAQDGSEESLKYEAGLPPTETVTCQYSQVNIWAGETAVMPLFWKRGGLS